VKMSVAPGVMTAFALSRNAAGSPLFCDAKKIFSFDLLSPVAVTSAQRRCPSGSVPWSALNTSSFRGETTCGLGIPARPISTPFRYTYTVLSALLIITETGPVGDLSGFQSNWPAAIGSLSSPLLEKKSPGCTVVAGAEGWVAMVTGAPFLFTSQSHLEKS